MTRTLTKRGTQTYFSAALVVRLATNPAVVREHRTVSPHVPRAFIVLVGQAYPRDKRKREGKKQKEKKRNC